MFWRLLVSLKSVKSFGPRFETYQIRAGKQDAVGGERRYDGSTDGVERRCVTRTQMFREIDRPQKSPGEAN